MKFKRFLDKEQKVDVTNLAELFDSLDRQTTHTELRIAQKQALSALEKRRADRDLVMKMSTGTGKTALALLYLQSHMEEKEEPVTYLCPTTQLVEQVVEEATRIGISAEPYRRGETHPHVDCISAKAIIVCTYDKLFNAKTTFDRSDVFLTPCAMALDDAHAGVEEIREAFTLRISDHELQRKLVDLLSPSCQKYQTGTWQGIVDGDPAASMEIPYWMWKPLIGEVQKLVSPYAKNGDLAFVWPFLREMLRWCRCVASGTGVEVVPDIQPVHKSRAFSNAGHRLFMSATLADDSVLVRELGCSLAAARSPIIPRADKGLGERMVLAPSLISKDLDRAWIMRLCAKLARKVRVVVLSPSENAASEWGDVGAKVVVRDAVSTAVKDLKKGSSQSRFVVFAQRYDGLDLPDNACRILVLDGMPFGEGVTDRYDASLREVAGGTRNRLIYRIEQGMGRAVRSHADYAVVILAGPELAHFVAKREVLAAMNPDTEAQLKLAIDLASLAKEEEGDNPDKTVEDMIKQCLARDEGWKQYYNEKVRFAKGKISAHTDAASLSMAHAERQAFESAVANDCSQAVKILSQAINDNQLSEKEKDRYLQKIANFKYDCSPGEALEIQRDAHEKNDSMFCPPATARKPPAHGKYDVETVILEWYKQFQNPNGAIAAIQEFRARLSYSVSPAQIEQALKELAPLLGAIGSRPEKESGEGPDDLWLWPSRALVIEAKNKNVKSLHKKDAEQLLHSLYWFKTNFPTREDPVPVVVAKMVFADPKSGFPKGTRVLTQEKVGELLDALEGFSSKLSANRLCYGNLI